MLKKLLQPQRKKLSGAADQFTLPQNHEYYQTLGVA